MPRKREENAEESTKQESPDVQSFRDALGDAAQRSRNIIELVPNNVAPNEHREKLQGMEQIASELIEAANHPSIFFDPINTSTVLPNLEELMDHSPYTWRRLVNRDTGEDLVALKIQNKRDALEMEAIINSEIAPYIIQFDWRLTRMPHGFDARTYVVDGTKKGCRRLVSLKRMVCGDPSGINIFTRDGDNLNCARSNLTANRVNPKSTLEETRGKIYYNPRKMLWIVEYPGEAGLIRLQVHTEDEAKACLTACRSGERTILPVISGDGEIHRRMAEAKQGLPEVLKDPHVAAEATRLQRVVLGLEEPREHDNVEHLERLMNTHDRDGWMLFALKSWAHYLQLDCERLSPDDLYVVSRSEETIILGGLDFS